MSLIDSIGSSSMFEDTSTPYVPSHADAAPRLEIVPKKLNYIFQSDRIALSFSRLQTLRICPRMFQCRELCGQGSYTPTIHTAYGHAFAAGVQELFRSGSLTKAFMAALEAWDYPYFSDPWGKAHNKSFNYAVASIQTWYETIFPQLADDYQIAVLNNHAAIELFVYLEVGIGYDYQIHIDIILERKSNGALTVFEIKTSGMPQQRANWENSIQTLGYYTEVATIAAMEGRYVDPDIVYIVQQVGKLGNTAENNGFYTFIFSKGEHAATEFMMDLATQTAIIELYIENGYFPKYGHSCVQFGKPCQFFGTCDSIPLLAREQSQSQNYENSDLTAADYVLTFESIITTLDGNPNGTTT